MRPSPRRRLLRWCGVVGTATPRRGGVGGAAGHPEERASPCGRCSVLVLPTALAASHAAGWARC
jgi:hypothetical protein